MRLIDADVFEVISLQDKSEEFCNGVMWVLEQIDKQPTAYDIDNLKQQIRIEVIEEFNRKIDYLKNCYVDACNMCTRMECDVCAVSNFIDDLEQLKENK